MYSTHRKRLFTILLSLLLTVSMLPAGVFADIADGSEDQGQVATETVDQDETSASEQSADVNKGSSEPAKKRQARKPKKQKRKTKRNLKLIKSFEENRFKALTYGCSEARIEMASL